MICKCCGESAEFTLKEEGYLKNRYQCSNCNKTFWEDSRLLKDVQKFSLAITVITVVSKVASGDLLGAVISIANGGNGDTLG
jgi:hypothetical protein